MLDKLTTELRNPRTMNLDEMSTLDILRTMNQEDESVLEAIDKQLSNIEKAVQFVIESFNNNVRQVRDSRCGGMCSYFWDGSGDGSRIDCWWKPGNL